MVRLPALLFLIVTPVWAVEQSPPDISAAQVLLPLFMVISLIFALAWLVRKMNLGTTTVGKEIQLIANIPVSPQARVSLIRVGGKDILLGVTNQNVEHLHTFDDPVAQPDNGQNSELSHQFKKLLKREHPTKPNN